jgi:hypothetical protein
MAATVEQMVKDFGTLTDEDQQHFRALLDGGGQKRVRRRRSSTGGWRSDCWRTGCWNTSHRTPRQRPRVTGTNP